MIATMLTGNDQCHCCRGQVVFSGHLVTPYYSTTLPLQVRQSPEDITGTCTPILAQCREIAIARIKASAHGYGETVEPVADQVDGHTDGQITAHSGFEGQQDTFRI